ncbi:hypothetical protein D3C86_1685170 [compost metagenome]
MAAGIGQRFLRDAKDRGAEFGAELADGLQRQLAGDAAALGKRLGQPLDRRGQPQLIQQRRAQVCRDALHRVHRRIRDLLEHLQMLAARVAGIGALLRFDKAESQAQCRQGLPKLIVQLA